MSNEKSEEDNLFAKSVHFIDQNLRTVRIGIVLTGGIGLALIFRNLRLFLKIRSVEDIPAGFISRHVSLRGKVKGVSEDRQLLVDHFPKLTLFARQKDSEKLLPVTLTGINPTLAGKYFLMEELNGKNVKFTIVGTCPSGIGNDKKLHCIVKRDNMSSQIKKRTIAEELVKKKFAEVALRNTEWNTFPKYRKMMDRLEEINRKRNRSWNAANVSENIWSVGSKISSLFKKLINRKN